MRWYKHYTDASENPKIDKLIMKYGMLGYGFYFYLLERIGKFDSVDGYLSEKYDIEYLSLKSQLDQNKMIEMLNYMVEIKLLDKKEWDENQKIYCPKLLKRADEYTTKSRNRQQKSKNVRRVSGECREMSGEYPLRIEQNRTEQNRLEKTKNKIICADSKSVDTDEVSPLLIEPIEMTIEKEIETRCPNEKSIQTVKKALDMNENDNLTQDKCSIDKVKALFKQLKANDKVEDIEYYEEALKLQKFIIDKYGDQFGNKSFKMLNSWAKDIRLLNKSGCPKDELPPQTMDDIDNVMKWVFAPDCPIKTYKIESGKSFREKFSGILLNMANPRNKSSPNNLVLQPFNGKSGRVN